MIISNRLSQLKTRFAALVTLAFIASAPIQAAEYSDALFIEKQGLIETLFDAADIDKSIGVIPGALQAQFDAELAKMSSPDMSQEQRLYLSHLSEEAKKLFSAEEMTRSVQISMHDAMDHAELEQMISWYSSDFGRKIQTLEQKSLQPEFHINARKFQANSSDQDNIARDQLLQKIMYQLKTDKMIVAIASSMSKSLVLGMSSSVNQEIQQALIQASLQMDRDIELFLPAVQEQLTTMTAFMYSELVDAELTRYLNALKLPAFVSLNDSFIKGLKVSMNESGYELGVSMGRYIMTTAELDD